jgi:hypothetical protein
VAPRPRECSLSASRCAANSGPTAPPG